MPADCETEWVFSLPIPPADPEPFTDIANPEPHSISPGSEEAFMTAMTAEVADYGMGDAAAGSSAGVSYGQTSSSDVWLDDPNVSPSNTGESAPEAPSIEQLKSRGKGHYTCPRGTACDKGGVQINGQLTVYERNSAFRYVLISDS